MYVRRITHSTTILLARTGVRKISSVACGFSPIKIHFSDNPKSLISRINEVYVVVFQSNIAIVKHILQLSPFVLRRSGLLLCWNGGICDNFLETRGIALDINLIYRGGTNCFWSVCVCGGGGGGRSFEL